MRTPARILAVLAPALLVLALPPAALADFLTPESGGSPNADSIDTLYKIVFAMAMAILIGVWAALLYSMIKFRARRGAVPAQIRGNTRLEIGWTVGAALILVVIAVVTFVTLDDIRNAPESGANGLQIKQVSGQPSGTPDTEAVPPSGKSLRIQVNGQQYVWRYTYGDGDDNLLNNAFSYEEMVVPVDTTVTLEIKAQDVAHSWWIPQLGGKFDAVPGHTNWTWFKIPADKAGTVFRGQCAELCGRNHANMIAHVRAVTPDEYEAYIERRKDEIKANNEAAQKQREEIENK
ncbi:MAG TPA: cytochrome c oxidase subunit II [Solirubrobacteraceae bacterium]